MIKRMRKLNKMLITHPDLYRVTNNDDGAHCFPVGTIVRHVGGAHYENIHPVKCDSDFPYTDCVVETGTQQILWRNEVSK